MLNEPDGRTHKCFEFFELDIHVGVTSKHLTLKHPKHPHQNEMALDTKSIRSVQWSRDRDCAILRIECAGNDKYDIRFHDHMEMEDFVECLQRETALKTNNSSRTKYICPSPSLCLHF
jgi:hypothetical protein